MDRERKKVYSPPRIKTVDFVVELGLGMATARFEPLTWDAGTPGSHSSLFEQSDWNYNGGNSTTSFELERW